MSSYRLLEIISQSISALPFLVALINFKQIKVFLIPVFALLIVSAGVELITSIFYQSGIDTLYIFHFFTIVEFLLISLFFALFFKKYFNPLVYYMLILVFLVVAYVDYKTNGLNSTDNFSVSVESFILTFYTLFFFYYVLKNLLFENLLAQPEFWINTAILFYFSGNFVLFVFSNYMVRVDLDKYIILRAIIHTFFNVLYNVFLSIGFWKARIK